MWQGDRESYRRVFCEAWRKQRDGEALEPLESEIVDVVLGHPEYQGILEDPERALDRDWTPEQGETNPFLHLSMHLAIREQVATDRPSGIADIHARLRRRTGDAIAAEHEMMECLGRTLWEAQRAGTGPDEAGYLECLRRLAPRD